MIRQIHRSRPIKRQPFIVSATLFIVLLLAFSMAGLAQEEPFDGAESMPALDESSAPLDPAIEEILSHCNEQAPQEFLKRSNYIRRRGMSDEERAARDEAHERAIRYRTENYGYFEGFGEPEWNESTPRENTEETEFMGHTLRLNRRVIPALRCVEAEIQRSCADTPYDPHRVSGLRTRNTFHTGEISNHVYGIALDIDSDLNTCCGCTARWRAHPLCQREVDSIFERMAMPECWVHAFERYGFYWLGWDELEDTMHYEFLGDPNLVLIEDADEVDEQPALDEHVDSDETLDSPGGGQP